MKGEKGLRTIDPVSMRERGSVWWAGAPTQEPQVRLLQTQDDRWAILHQSPDAQEVFVESVPRLVEREHRRDPLSRSAQEVRNLFKLYADEWREETQFLSSLSEIVAHPAYQKIIGLGTPVVPSIIAELRAQPELWFWALTSIVGEDHAVGSETVGEAAERWIKWFDGLMVDSDW